ncbi:SURF1 family protein [Microbispora sp. RL4-1S]|uniref:SURF1-like protein n=1 Tax=Microbispora oryzae TaxID=2806554 RepID=A0A940WNC9_9ACTN|nr:SURF1 family protein [Microbispora oryzae]MBP2704595.1 SURF1 family protein [Microbispora oryzae]
MYRFLLTPRWLGFHLLVLALIPAFLFLGRWQWGRYEERSAASTLITANLAERPIPLDRIDAAGAAVPEAHRYRPVTATGRYDETHQLLVRRRTQNSQVGYYVVTPLVTSGGAVLVNRGWIPVGTNPDAPEHVPAPPTGEVSVTGRLRPAETEDSTGLRNRPDLPAGQVLLVNTADIGRGLPYRLYGGFVELTAQTPQGGPAPEPVPAPDVGEGGGLNLAYAIQWWLFIGVAVGGWVTLIRREARDLQDEGSDPVEPDGTVQPVRPGSPEANRTT